MTLVRWLMYALVGLVPFACASEGGQPKSWPAPPPPGFVPTPRPDPNDYSWVTKYDPNQHPKISLVTAAPNVTLLDRFGETALRVRMPATKTDLAYTHCFARLDPHTTELQLTRQLVTSGVEYELRVIPYRNYLARFASEGREVTEQELNLDFAQARHLVEQLTLNAQAGARAYSFDPYRQTCASRTRDLIDMALDGRLLTELQDAPSGRTLREETLRHLADEPMKSLLLDVFLGPYTDQPLSHWDASFLPANLKRSVEMLRSEGAHGAWALVKQSQQVVQGGEWRVSNGAPDRRGDNLRAGLVLGALIAVLGSRGGRAKRRRKQIATGLITLLVLVLSTIGCALGWLWLRYDNAALVRNANTLVFAPWAILTVGTWLWSLKDQRALRWWLGLIASAAIACALAGAIRLSNGSSQDNLAVVALVLPIWVGLTLAAHWVRQEEAKVPSETPTSELEAAATAVESSPEGDLAASSAALPAESDSKADDAAPAPNELV